MVLWALTTLVVVLAILVELFVKKTRLTLLGNSWSAFMQMAVSQGLMQHMADSSVVDNATVLQNLKMDHKAGLRARVVRTSDGAEVRVE